MASAFRKSLVKKPWSKPHLTKLTGEAADRARIIFELKAERLLREGEKPIGK